MIYTYNLFEFDIENSLNRVGKFVIDKFDTYKKPISGLLNKSKDAITNFTKTYQNVNDQSKDLGSKTGDYIKSGLSKLQNINKDKEVPVNKFKEIGDASYAKKLAEKESRDIKTLSLQKIKDATEKEKMDRREIDALRRESHKQIGDANYNLKLASKNLNDIKSKYI